MGVRVTARVDKVSTSRVIFSSFRNRHFGCCRLPTVLLAEPLYCPFRLQTHMMACNSGRIERSARDGVCTSTGTAAATATTEHVS